MVYAIAFVLCMVCFGVGLWLGLTAAAESEDKPIKIENGKIKLEENEVQNGK